MPQARDCMDDYLLCVPIEIVTTVRHRAGADICLMRRFGDRRDKRIVRRLLDLIGRCADEPGIDDARATDRHELASGTPGSLALTDPTGESAGRRAGRIGRDAAPLTWSLTQLGSNRDQCRIRLATSTVQLLHGRRGPL